jgi:hypothetical protein
MAACEYLLAIVLLTTPPDRAVCQTMAPLAAALRPALVDVAVAVEILDVRAVTQFAGEEARPADELYELQSRYQTLQRAPRLAECGRFPSKRLIDEWLRTNRDCKAALEARLAVDQIHAAVLRQAIAETEELYGVWSLLRDAQNVCFHINARRWSLLELRDRIGIEAYCRSCLPPHLPLWHFPAWR